MTLNFRMYDAVVAVLPDLRLHCRDPWMVIGSAATRLVGARAAVADLDLLTSGRDADALMEKWRDRLDGEHVPADSDRFRSRFARFLFDGMPVEVMGGLEVFVADAWTSVQINSVVTVDLCGLVIPVPSVAEQIRVLKMFGRPKDLQRVVLLESLQGSATC